MASQPSLNPHKPDAVNAGTVKRGDRLIVWQPNVNGSRRDVTVASEPYEHEDGTWVIDASVDGDRVTQHATGDLGLTGDRHTGNWSHIAILNEEEPA